MVGEYSVCGSCWGRKKDFPNYLYVIEEKLLFATYNTEIDGYHDGKDLDSLINLKQAVEQEISLMEEHKVKLRTSKNCFVG